MPRPIDGSNFIEYLNTVVLPGLPEDKSDYARGKRHLVYTLTNLIISGAFDLTPPVQPDTGEVITDDTTS